MSDTQDHIEAEMAKLAKMAMFRCVRTGRCAVWQRCARAVAHQHGNCCDGMPCEIGASPVCNPCGVSET